MAAPGANWDLDSALATAMDRFTAANPKSQAQYESALKAMPGGNTRTVLYYPPFPLTVTGGQGCHLQDLDGHDYVDVLSEYTAGLYGHSHPVIRAAIDGALNAGITLGGQNEQEAAFAEAVTTRFPALEQVRFTNSGTEANLMAISSARVFTGRDKVMVMEGGYHGGVFYFAPGGSPINAPFPYLLGRFNDADYCRDLIRQHAQELACVILEPMLGGAGCLPGAPEFLAMLREETSAAGALLIFDEVMTSRLGPNGYQELLGLRADMTTLGKYVGGGMSFGAFGGRREIMAMYDPRADHPLPHAGTFNNNMLTMSAGLAGLREVYTEAEAIVFNARGDRLRADLQAAADRQGLAVQVTGRGSMLAVHFCPAPPTRLADLYDQAPAFKSLFHLEMLARGIYPAARGMMALSLPMAEDDYAKVLGAFEEFLAAHRSILS